MVDPRDEEGTQHGQRECHVYPVVRVDLKWLDLDDGGELRGLEIPIVLPTEEEAEAEAARLNALNGGKGYRYYSWLSRFYPDGRGTRDE